MFEGERALGATFDPAEIWRPVVGFEGRYEVSNLGRVRTLRGKYPRLLKPGKASNGYFTVALGRNNSRCIHALVLTAFVGPCPPGQEALHNSPDRTDSRLVNLRWSTRSQNIMDAVAHGTWNSEGRLAALDRGRQTRWGNRNV